MIQDYLFPTSVEEALKILVKDPEKSKVIGGGTSFYIDGKELAKDISYFIDLGQIKELGEIYEEDGFIVMGANTTLTQCSKNPLIKENYPALVKASANLGSTQIRNMATVVGNIVNGKPFSDLATVLMALDAVFTIEDQDGSRETKVKDMYHKLGISALKATELVTKIKIPKRVQGEGSAFQRLEIREGLSFPVINVAAKLVVDKNIIKDAVVTASPLAPGPKVIEAIGEFLIGKEATDDNFVEAGLLATKSIKFHTSPLNCGAIAGVTCKFENCHYCLNPVPSTAQYRHEVLPVLVKRCLSLALEEIND
ncbi:MAG: FAD binding domain-containing protein [Tissierellaceae bacterium]|nr:FAD binding domain-containing protein [Tissierellaceae bacterium]